MRAFLDFEASSLSDDSYPIEVAWVFEDGTSESHLIKPAPGWSNWGAMAEAIHGIERHVLVETGTPHDAVARRMVEVLTGHDLFASAPSWDGKWMSVLLRAAGLPRHALRLRDTDVAQAEVIVEVLQGCVDDDQAKTVIGRIEAALAAREKPPVAHRALDDARQEYARWCAARDLAEKERASLG